MPYTEQQLRRDVERRAREQARDEERKARENHQALEGKVARADRELMRVLRDALLASEEPVSLRDGIDLDLAEWKQGYTEPEVIDSVFLRWQDAGWYLEVRHGSRSHYCFVVRFRWIGSPEVSPATAPEGDGQEGTPVEPRQGAPRSWAARLLDWLAAVLVIAIIAGLALTGLTGMLASMGR